VTQLYTATDTVGTYLMKVLLEEIRNQRVMWAVMPAQQQQEVIDRMAKQVDGAVRIAAKKILGSELPSVIATLEQATVKDDGTKVTLVFPNEELHALTDAVGTKIVLVLADPEAHAAGVSSFKADADQQPLDID
jgi:hypothetical protein